MFILASFEHLIYPLGELGLAIGVGSSCRFGRQWYAIVAFGSFLVSVVSDVGLW